MSACPRRCRPAACWKTTIEARPRSGYFVLKPRRNGIPPVAEPDIRQALGAAQYVGIHDRVSDFIAKCEAHPVSANFALAAAVPRPTPWKS